MQQIRDLSYMTFGRLIALEYVGHRRWKCICECGEYHIAQSGNLVDGLTRSCGCLVRDGKPFKNGRKREKNGRHGLSKLREYEIWTQMLARCLCPTHKRYKSYGGRGITVCKAWVDSFEQFYADVGPRPSKDYSLDRSDNNGNYEPGNVRWATRIEQGRNMRSNRFITLNGERLTIGQWAERLGINQATLNKRLNSRAWSIERALSTPVRRRVLTADTA